MSKEEIQWLEALGFIKHPFFNDIYKLDCDNGDTVTVFFNDDKRGNYGLSYRFDASNTKYMHFATFKELKKFMEV